MVPFRSMILVACFAVACLFVRPASAEEPMKAAAMSIQDGVFDSDAKSSEPEGVIFIASQARNIRVDSDGEVIGIGRARNLVIDSDAKVPERKGVIFIASQARNIRVDSDGEVIGIGRARNLVIDSDAKVPERK
jgi:hypothetical protein